MKTKLICAWVVVLFGVNQAVAQEVLPPEISAEKEHYDSLVNSMEAGEEKARLEFANMTSSGESSSEAVTSQNEISQYPTFYKKRPRTSDEQLIELLDEVQTLKAKVVSTKQAAVSTERLPSRKTVGTKTYFNYQDGKIYEVHAGVDRVTDIELQSDETLTNAPLSGDTVRWKIGVVSSGKGVSAKTHLILKPLEDGIETNILIPTTKRVYHLRAVSGDWYMPSVAWNYPEEQAREVAEYLRKQKELEPVGLAPEELSFNYRIEGGDYSWSPLRVFDDGQKTYFQMPEEMSVTEAPVLFVIDDHDEPMLVNYRVKGAYYILDRLIERAQMRVGKKGIVTIYSSKYKRSLWERLF